MTIFKDKSLGNYNFIKINGKRKKLSRYIIEKKIKRKLTSFEIVHHKNGINDDDRITNLQILKREEHTSLHLSGKRKGYFHGKKKKRD